MTHRRVFDAAASRLVSTPSEVVMKRSHSLVEGPSMKTRKQVYLDPSRDLDTRLDKERIKAWNAERSFIDHWIAKGAVPGRHRHWHREDLYERKSSG